MRAWLAGFCALAGAAVAAAGCGKRPLPRPDAPRPRLITYSPALTQSVFEMGLGDHVVGVTSYCDPPPGQERPVVGDLQSINRERIRKARPDVILIQQEAKNFAAVRQDMPEVRIEHFTIETLGHIAEALERIGRIAGNEQLALRRRRAFERAMADVAERVRGRPRPRVFFLTQADPPAVAGRQSFIHQMIELAGGQDLSGQYERWGQINVERILLDKPEIIICQAEPSGVDDARQYLGRLTGVPAVRDGRVHIVTDRHWTIPSTRMAELAMTLAEMIHPDLAGQGDRP